LGLRSPIALPAAQAGGSHAIDELGMGQPNRSIDKAQKITSQLSEISEN
jgi:hypothetical protein